MLDDIFAGRDAHCSTAAAMFNVPYELLMEAKSSKEHTEEQKMLLVLRQRAKTLNFGILYGEGSFRLAEQLGISVNEARGLLQLFRETYPQLHRYFARVIEEGQKTGYCYTLLGRIRRLSHLLDEDTGRAAADERKAKNSPIQGGADGIITAAMLKLSELPWLVDGRVSLLLQVHDELVLEADAEIEHDEDFNSAFERCMLEPLGTFSLTVPLTIDRKWCDNWFEGKS